MASRMIHRRSPSGSSAALDSSVGERSPGPSVVDPYASAASSIFGDASQWTDAEIQNVYNIAERAQRELLELKPKWRTPTHALFRALNKIYEENGSEPPDDLKRDDLLFKIGGYPEGRTIPDKFRSVMARMNIELDTNETNPEHSTTGSTEDEHSSNDLHAESIHDERHPGPTKHANGLDAQKLHHDGQWPAFPGTLRHLADSHDGERMEEQPGQKSSEIALENNVLGFERYRKKTHAVHAVQEWQARAAKADTILELYLNAKAKDLEASLPSVVVAWHEVALEIDESPLDEVPPNVYSKRIENIAVRTRQIYAMKNALSRWRRITRENCQEYHNDRPSDLPDRSYDEELRLSRLAIRAHENLMKSRAFTRWSNRILMEEQKAQIAVMAHEMGLKSRAFGLRLKLEDLASALRQRVQARMGQNEEQLGEAIPDPDMHLAQTETELKEPPATMHESPLASKTVTEQASGPEEKAVSANESLSNSAKLPSAPLKMIEKSSEDEESEDERTMLARRHILRTKIFQAWEDYTRQHTLKAQDFALQRVLHPWLEKTHGFFSIVAEVVQRHDDHVVNGVLRDWRTAVTQIDERSTDAHEARRRLQLISVLKPWMAEARYRSKHSKLQRQCFEHWQLSQNQNDFLATQALAFRRRQQLISVLSQWRLAAATTQAERHELECYADRADYWRSLHGTIQEWKARSRGNAVHVLLKREALESWRGQCQSTFSRKADMERFAERADFYYSTTGLLPAWRDATRHAVRRCVELQKCSEGAEYESNTREALLEWRALAREKRKARLIDNYNEVRRVNRKNLGAQAIHQWRRNLSARQTQSERISIALDGVNADREWEATAHTLDTWRRTTQQRIEMDAAGDLILKQKGVDGWRKQVLRRAELRLRADEYRAIKVRSRAVKDWKLNSLQMEGRRQTVRKHLNKDRKLLKNGFEGWYAKTASRFVPAQHPDGSGRSVEDMIQDAREQATQSQARVLFPTWRAATGESQDSRYGDIRREELEAEEEAAYASTPGRPSLLLGGLGAGQTTTPLAPIPQRQAWQSFGVPDSGGPRDSILGRSAPGGAAGRPGRSRRNLRVSWAE